MYQHVVSSEGFDGSLTVGVVPIEGPVGGILLAGEMLSLDAPAATSMLETRVFCLLTPAFVRSLMLSFVSSAARALDGAMACDRARSVCIDWRLVARLSRLPHCRSNHNPKASTSMLHSRSFLKLDLEEAEKSPMTTL